MLLDRKKINRFTRWFAIGLAIVFALSGIFLGVGSKTGNVFGGCSKQTGSLSANSSLEDRVAYYRNLIEQNPQDTDSMLALANLYGGSDVGKYDDAIIYYKMYLAIVPNNVDALMLVGRAQLNKGDNEGAVKTLIQVTQLAPTNSYAYLQLGLAAKAAGQNQTAILAWNKWLEMNPNDSNAQAVKDEIANLVTKPAVEPKSTATIPGTEGTPAPSGTTVTVPLPAR